MSDRESGDDQPQGQSTSGSDLLFLFIYDVIVDIVDSFNLSAFT